MSLQIFTQNSGKVAGSDNIISNIEGGTFVEKDKKKKKKNKNRQANKNKDIDEDKIRQEAKLS